MYGVGGIVGWLVDYQGIVQNNIALNQSIIRTSGTETNFGRIAGLVSTGGTHTGNRAWSGMPFDPLRNSGNALDNVFDFCKPMAYIVK